MITIYKIRRSAIVIFALFVIASAITINTPRQTNHFTQAKIKTTKVEVSPANDVLATLEIKGRAPKTGYSREQFGASWTATGGCDTRNIILNRDLTDSVVDGKCNVTSGTLNDPYTGKVISFKRGSDTSSEVQIDHVVALSDAWQKGAQYFTMKERIVLANDPLELLAVDGAANLQKSDGDAATWLPPNKPFRCQYIARQIAVKQKYRLWLTQAEHDAMFSILNNCPGQLLPSP